MNFGSPFGGPFGAPVASPITGRPVRPDSGKTALTFLSLIGRFIRKLRLSKRGRLHLRTHQRGANEPEPNWFFLRRKRPSHKVPLRL
jgi:hypothetical protein